MRSDVRALLRPLMKTVGLLLAVALGIVACLLVLLVIVRGSDASNQADAAVTIRYSVKPFADPLTNHCYAAYRRAHRSVARGR